MSREVLLVNPNRIRPPIAPLAIEYLTHALEMAGIAWRVADLCLADDPRAELADAVRAGDPSLVGVTFRNTDDCHCATQHSFIPDLQALVADVRALTDAPIVLGGAGLSVAPAGILRRTGADFGVVGDGEGALVRLAQSLVTGWKACPSGPSIAGLLVRRGEEVVGTEPGWEMLAQESLPRTALDNARYFREGGQLGIETKRGCEARCVYCADGHSKGPHVRTRSPAAVAHEMLSLAARGMDVFHTCDSEFNSDARHAMAVCEELAATGAADRLRWYAYCSPTPFTAELARLMRDAGCVGVNFGTDSGDAEMLRRLGREHTPEDIVACVRACHEAGMVVMLDLLLGAPGETRESLARSLELVREAEADCVGVALGVRLYPNTPLVEQLLGDGIRGHDPSSIGPNWVMSPNSPGLRGQVADNDDLAMPLFYLEPKLGDDPVGLVKELIGGDQRFFFGWPDDTQADYNYDDNPELVGAIANGHRGAYWDILRKVRGM